MTSRRLQILQNMLQMFTVTGIAVAFMLFLLGNLDVLSNLVIVSVLLCVSMVAGGGRIIALNRRQNVLQTAQSETGSDVRSLGNRLNDHDLFFIDLTGKVDDLQGEINDLRDHQQKQDKWQRQFMIHLKDKITALADTLQKSKEAAPPAPSPRKTPVLTAPLPAAEPAKDLGDIVISPTLIREAMKAAIMSERIELYLQPIATLPQRRAYGYEIYGRLRVQPGLYVPARDYSRVAAEDHKQAELDRLVLLEMTRLLMQGKVPMGPLFINLSGPSLADPAVLKMFISMIKGIPGLARRLIVDVTQTDFRALGTTETKVIRELTQLGLRFALDNVVAPQIDLDRMAHLGFTFLKLPHERLLPALRDDMASPFIERFLTRLQERGLTLIVGGIEKETEIRRLLDYPVTLAQGYVFGRPDRPVAFTPRKAA